MHARVPRSPGVSLNGQEFSRLVNAAIVSKAFCDLLLTDAASALAAGYNGESFCLATEDRELILSIQATSLSDFALQLTNRRNGKGNPHRHSLPF
jgi:hypothetical protein